MKRFSVISLIILLLLLTACGGSEKNNASGPFTFHDITVTIPDGYLQDMSRSDENTQWFQSAWTKEQILVYRATPPVSGEIGEGDADEKYDELIQSYDDVSDYSSSQTAIGDIPALNCRYVQEEQYVLATYMNIGDYLYGVMMFNEYEYSDEAYGELIKSVEIK